MLYPFAQKIKEDYQNAKFSPMLLCLNKTNLNTGSLLQIQQFLYEQLIPYSAFLVIIRSNLGKIIGCFFESKFESTRGMEYEINGFNNTNAKLINNSIIYYFLDNQLVKCTWKHSQKAKMLSNDEYFLSILGLNIQNNRNEKDFAFVDDSLFSGMNTNNTYPKKELRE